MIAIANPLKKEEKTPCQVCGKPVPEGRKVNCSRKCTVRAADCRRRGIPITSRRQKVRALHIKVEIQAAIKLLKRIAIRVEKEERLLSLVSVHEAGERLVAALEALEE